MIDSRMFDFKSFYERMANAMPQECSVAEVGVASGASALFLAEKLHEFGKQFKLYMIDSLDYGGNDQLMTIVQNVERSGLSEFIEVIPLDSLNASCKFNDNSLDFVFVDSSHLFSQTKADILLWERKIKEGCVLAGHDYFSTENPGVKQAVDELVPERITFDETTLQILHTEQTDGGNGIWYFRKQNYFWLNR